MNDCEHYMHQQILKDKNITVGRVVEWAVKHYKYRTVCLNLGITNNIDWVNKESRITWCEITARFPELKNKGLTEIREQFTRLYNKEIKRYDNKY